MEKMNEESIQLAHVEIKEKYLKCIVLHIAVI